MKKRSQLLDRYNVPAPRYTSYPTVPHWQSKAPSPASWRAQVKDTLLKNNEISLYLHLPFCERLCTYCGCNKRITKNHAVELPYIKALKKEWEMYRNLMEEPPVIRQLHLGGGTPTFFDPAALQDIISFILKDAIVPIGADFSFEAHPSSTTDEHLFTLRQLGFNRLSIGIQDFDQQILRVINRFQTKEQIVQVTQVARSLGYTSINYDLIFGLPFQTKEHIKKNMYELEVLKPDRLAFYSYAHVPWVSPSQRAYSEADLPNGAEKRALYELGCELLEKQGYAEIGMDHFALKSDELYLAQLNKELHRNFMGYTPFSTDLSIGLGASSISDSWGMYVQNEKRVEPYQDAIMAGEWPIIRGHELSEQDKFTRRHVLNLMCNFETSWPESENSNPLIQNALERIQEMEEDGLLVFSKNKITVTGKGQPYVRNICMAFDYRCQDKPSSKPVFSKVI